PGERRGRLADVTRAPKSIHGSAIERRQRLRLGKLIGGAAPGPSRDEPHSVAPFVPAPLLDVAGHIVSAGRAHALVLADARGAAAAEVARADDVGRRPELRRLAPVRKRGQALPANSA